MEVQAGNQSHSNDSLPGLVALLNRLPVNGKPQFVRGDIGWGTDHAMKEMEAIKVKKDKDLAISKLTKYERELLGFK